MAQFKTIAAACFLLEVSFVALLPNDKPLLGYEPLRPNLVNRAFDSGSEQGGVLHECYRRCEQNSPKTCIYNVTIDMGWPMSKCGDCPFTPEDCHLSGCITAGGYNRQVSVANGMLPGPAVLVCLNDTVIFNVENGFESDSTSIHFHGAHQRGSPWMDGTPYITQCPILPGNSYQYKFTASPAGTHMWHGHTGVHEADGLFGLYTVRTPEDFDNELYDYDEHEISLWLWSNVTATKYVSATDRGSQSFDLLINGLSPGVGLEKDGKIYKTPRAEFVVEKGKRYRFRTIYNSLFTCPMQISIDQHKLTMIATDSGEFQPVEVESFHTNAGERYDFVLNPDAKVGTYWIRVKSISCNGNSVQTEAILRYTDSKDAEPTYKPDLTHRPGKVFNPIEYVTRTNYKPEELISITDIDSKEPTRDISGTPNVTLYMELRFGDETLYPQINGMTFEYPHMPLLTQWSISNKTCSGKSPEKYCMNGLCVCTQIQKIAMNSLVEIVLVDTTPGNPQEHPMHLHGDHFQPVAWDVLGDDITLEQVKRMNVEGKINKKFENVVYKDTLTIPNLGYAVIRTVANNPGYWFFHCHFTNHAHIGMAMVFQVGDRDKDFPEPPKGFPQCDQFPATSAVRNKAFSLVSSLPSIVVFSLVPFLKKL